MSSPSSSSSDNNGSEQRPLSKYQLYRLRKRRKLSTFEEQFSDESSEASNQQSELSSCAISTSEESEGIQNEGDESSTDDGRSDGDYIEGQDDTIGENLNQAGVGAESLTDSDIQADDSERSDIQADDSGRSEIEADDSGRSDIEADDDASVLLSDVNSESEEEVEHNREDEPLYPGAPLTLEQSLLSVLTFAITHKLTGKGIQDLLTLIMIHCPPDNSCIKTLYKFKKYFSMLGNAMLVLHYFCSDCVYSVPAKDSICPLCNRQNISYFIEMPLLNQLRAMLKRDGFYNDLQYRFQRRKKSPTNVEDIYDSEMYKNQFQHDGFLRNPNHISFMWYSDGISIFKSTNFSIWPLFYVINELHPKKRFLRENIILAGLWFGPKKPTANLFLRPFSQSLQEFQTQGFDMERPDRPPVCIRGMLLCGVCDLQAKCIFMHLKQFNARFGCPCCVTEGTRYDLGNNTVQVYPYSPEITLRDNEDMVNLAAQAVEARARDPTAAVLGVKGPAILHKMVPDMIRCTGIDRMHGIDLGVAKQLMLIMSDPSNSGMPYTISTMLDVVDNRLAQIRPPNTVERVPRSVRKHLAKWKASEFKFWFYYYSIPILSGILQEDYLRHLCLLISAVYLLDQGSISLEQINTASRLLHRFVSFFEEYYGQRHMGINVHQLLHLPQCVKDLGPLWVYSCYAFEDLNGKLACLIHSNKHPGLQVCSASSAFLNLPIMIKRLPVDSEAYKFCSGLRDKVKHVKIAEEVSPRVYAVGTYSVSNDDVSQITRVALQSSFRIEGGHCRYFSRLQKNGVLYHSTLYKRCGKKESSYASFMENQVPILGRIKCFVKWSECGLNCVHDCNVCASQFFCIVNLYQCEEFVVHNIPDVSLPYLHKVTATDEIRAFSLASIQSLCFYMKVDQDEYIATPVNDFEAQ